MTSQRERERDWREIPTIFYTCLIDAHDEPRLYGERRGGICFNIFIEILAA